MWSASYHVTEETSRFILSTVVERRDLAQRVLFTSHVITPVRSHSSTRVARRRITQLTTNVAPRTRVGRP